MCPSNGRKIFFIRKRSCKFCARINWQPEKSVEAVKNDKSIIRSSLESNLQIVLSQTKLLEEKDRLRNLCHKEVEKLLKKKKEKARTKRKKGNEDALLNIPIVTSVDEFVGKRVQHLPLDYDGKERWFLGVVVCRKPDSDTELVIHYDSEDKLILLIFQASRILLLNWLQPHQQIFLGKRIRQRFTNIEENDFWWEQRIVISQDLNNSWNFIVNFFDNDEYDERDSSLNIYEVLVLPLIDDYLNHDAQFL